MKQTDNLKRDSLILKHACLGGVEFDASLGRYRFYFRADDTTFNKIAAEAKLAGLKFDNADFNNFINGLCGNRRLEHEEWVLGIDEQDILPGEAIILNLGLENMVMLIKVKSSAYLVVESKNHDLLLSSIATNGSERFEPRKTTTFEVLGKFKVESVRLLPPPQVNRALDFSNSHFGKNTVSTDISPLVRETLTALGEGEFVKKFQSLTELCARHGVSTFVLRLLADAYTTKHHPIN